MEGGKSLFHTIQGLQLKTEIITAQLNDQSQVNDKFCVKLLAFQNCQNSFPHFYIQGNGKFFRHILLDFSDVLNI